MVKKMEWLETANNAGTCMSVFELYVSVRTDLCMKLLARLSPVDFLVVTLGSRFLPPPPHYHCTQLNREPCSQSHQSRTHELATAENS